MDRAEVKQLLITILAKAPGTGDLTRLLDFCHKMAVACIHAKLRRGRFNAGVNGLSVPDFALDAIAELFARDPDGRFRVLQDYFGTLGPLQLVAADTIEILLRRLVFGAVNTRIFRSCAESNSGLSRILRNVKLALKDHSTISIQELNGDKFVTLRRNIQTISKLPEMPIEYLSAELCARCGCAPSLADILTRVVEILGSTTEYRPAFSLVGTAMLIEHFYAVIGKPAPGHTPADTLLERELEKIVSQVAHDLHRYAETSYVDSGKRDPKQVAAYIKTVEQILRAEFVQFDGDGISLSGALREHMPGLSLQEYRQFHRNVLEYLVKMGRQEVRTVLQKDLPQSDRTDTN